MPRGRAPLSSAIEANFGVHAVGIGTGAVVMHVRDEFVSKLACLLPLTCRYTVERDGEVESGLRFRLRLRSRLGSGLGLGLGLGRGLRLGLRFAWWDGPRTV